MPPSNRTLTDGSPVPDDDSHLQLKPNGQQRGYVVLSVEERAKGFVKPFRNAYKHLGLRLPTNLRDLTEEEKARYSRYGYVKFEAYGTEVHPLLGKFWTQRDLERADRGCGCVTTMGNAIAETYARDPGFYSGTFCCGCGQHFPLNEFVWEPDGEPMDPSLQAAWHEKMENTREAVIQATTRLEAMENLAAVEVAEEAVKEFPDNYEARLAALEARILHQENLIIHTTIQVSELSRLLQTAITLTRRDKPPADVPDIKVPPTPAVTTS